MRVLVTGIAGFAGAHMAEHLVERGEEVSGASLDPRSPFLDAVRARHPRALPDAALAACDVRDGEALRACLRRFRPQGIVHLAGLAFVPRSHAEPRAAYDVNLLGSVELLAAVRDEAPAARVVLVTSAEVYGMPASLPLRESHPLQPLSPYGVAKAAADLAGFQFHWSHGLDVVRARPFNHTGPGQAPLFVCSEFARAVAAAEVGAGPTLLRTGNLEVERDFSDVRDIVAGYAALLDRGRGGEAYNLGSGRPVRVSSVLDRLRGLGRVALTVETDPAKLRPREPPCLWGAIDKIECETGWRPTRALDRTLEDLVAYWREALHG